MKKPDIKKLAIILAALVVAYTLIGFFALPPLVKWLAEKKLTELLHRRVSIEDIDFNPYALTATVKGFAVKQREGEGDLAAFDSLFANLQGMSLFRLGIVVSEFRLTNPRLNISRLEPGSYNFSDLIPAPEEAPPAEKKPASQVNFSVNNIQIINGRIEFHDAPMGKTHTVQGLTLTLPFISNFRAHVDTFVEPLLAAEVNGKPVAIRGKAKPFASRLETVFDIDLTDVDVPYYLAYVPEELRFKVPSALLDVKANLNFVTAVETGPSLVLSGEAALKDVSITDTADAPLVNWERLQVEIAASELLAGKIHLSRIGLERPEITLKRSEEGAFNFQQVIPAGAPPEGETSTKSPSTQPELQVDEIVIDKCRILFTDLSKNPAFESTLSPVDLKVSDFSNQKNRWAAMDLVVNSEAGETVSLKGKFSIDPLASTGTLSLAQAVLTKYAPYYGDYVKFNLEGGTLDFRTGFDLDFGQADPTLTVDGEAALNDFSITGPGGEPLLKWERLQVAIAPSEPFAGKIHLSRIGVTRPEITLERTAEGGFNFQQVMPAAASPEAETPSEPPTGQPDLQVDEIAIEEGRVFFRDLAENPPFETTLFPVALKISDFNNQKDRSAAMDLVVNSEAGETASLTGKFSIDPPATTGTLSLARAVLAKYAPYYEDYVKFSVESGTLDFQTGFDIDLGEETPKVALADLSTRLQALKLKQLGEEKGFLDIPEFSVAQTSVDVNRRSIVVGEVLSQKGWLAIRRLKIGDLDVQHLFEAPQPSTPLEDSESEISDTPWQVALNHLLIDQYTVEGEDLTFAEPTRMSLDQIKLEVENFSTAAQSQAGLFLSYRYNEKGALMAKGKLGIDPLAGEFELKIDSYEPVWFQKYFEDQVQVIATGGKIDAGGTLSFAMTDEKGLTLVYRGDLQVADFKSVEQANSDEFVSFEKLAIEDAAISINPTSLSIKEIGLDHFFTRLVLTQDGRLNVQDTIKTGDKQAEATEPAQEEATVPVEVARVTLASGRVKFLDRFVAPGYATTLGGIEGTLTGLSTDRTKAADIQLKARLDEQAPLAITGKVNPLAEELYADVAIKFDEMDLSSLSPYSGKYAGYTIQKGKLFLDLNYRIENKSLQSKNIVRLDQFEFGKRVESKDATDLPVTLAVSLLKDRSGEIRLDLPVSGRLDDPQFSVAGVILKMIVNLLVKAATAPFALVEAVLGSGEELNQIEFAEGMPQLDDTATTKLDQLATALYDRPALKLDISGYADKDKDREGLAAIRFEDTLKAQKLKALTSQGQAAGSLEEVTIQPEEYETYLLAACAEAGIQAPESPPDQEKQQPPTAEEDEPASSVNVAEMERLLKASIRIDEGDLKILARDRAKTVQGYLLQTQKVEPERIFLTDPGTLTPPAAEGLKNSRVVLSLK